MSKGNATVHTTNKKFRAGYDLIYGKKIEGQYFWCECGACWREDETHIHDVSCPDCGELFLDGNVDRITKSEFEAIEKMEELVMRVPKQMTDQNFQKMVSCELHRTSAKYGYNFNSTLEALGKLGSLTRRLEHAVEIGNGKITTAVLREILGVSAWAARAAREYQFAGEKVYKCEKDKNGA